MKSKIETTVETIPASIEEAFRLAQEHGCTEITLKISVPLTRIKADLLADTEQLPATKEKPTTIDRLRSRGTPIELIHSYLIAEDPQAQTAFRTSVLEALYERLIDVFDTGATVRFEDINILERTANSLQRRFECDADDVFYGLALSPHHDVDLSKKGSTVGWATVHSLDIGDVRVVEISDSAQATIISSINHIVEHVEQHLVDQCVKAVSDHGQGHFTFGIIPKMCTTRVELIEHKKIATSADIAMYAFYHKNP